MSPTFNLVSCLYLWAVFLFFDLSRKKRVLEVSVISIQTSLRRWSISSCTLSCNSFIFMFFRPIFSEMRKPVCPLRYHFQKCDQNVEELSNTCEPLKFLSLKQEPDSFPPLPYIILNKTRVYWNLHYNHPLLVRHLKVSSHWSNYRVCNVG